MFQQIKPINCSSKHLHLPARLLMSVLFLVSGFGKVQNVEATQRYMEAYGVPGILLWPAAALEIGGGIALVMGWRTREWAMVLAPWCLLTAMIFHRDFQDQEQKINFMKNMAVAGGFFILADHGAPSWSIRIHLIGAEEDNEPYLPSVKQ